MLLVLKAFILLIANMGVGFLWAWLVMAFLFLPKRRLYLFGWPVPFTPGFLWRKKDWLFEQANHYVDDYLRAAMDEGDTESIVCEWENKVWQAGWDKLEALEQHDKIPRQVGQMLRRFIAQLAYEVARQGLRNFIPYLVEHYNARSWLDLACEKLDVGVVMRYANQYVFKYLYYFMLGLCFLIGLFNVIVFLLLQLF